MKYKLNDKISKCEALLEEKDQYEDPPKTGKDVATVAKIKNKIENLLEEIQKDIIDLEKELKSQKKKRKKFTDIETKEQILELLKEKIKILKNKYNGEEINEEEVVDNRTALEQLEQKLKEKQDQGGDSEGRELYDEEKEKIDQWKNQVNEQNEMLDELGNVVKELGNEARMAGEANEEINRRTKKLGKNIDKTQNKVKTQNERLNDLVNKIRSSDKICCDIVLILILLGLICVLYSVIKHKFK